MSPVLPIDTQRHQSGGYTLEVTAHPSPLSQWSDRTVVRQLRFSLWSEQPQRQRLAAGDQHQLMTISDAVETYVQRHLTQQAWPPRHHLTLLDQPLELSTLQLFDLAEVLNAYGQRQITLPARPSRQSSRRSRRWQTGSAAASLLVAVGITTAYLYYRPAAFNEVATTQAPEAIFDDEVAVSPEATIPEPRSSAPALESAPGGEQQRLETSEGSPFGDTALKTNQELAQQPLDQRELESARITAADPQLDAPETDGAAPPADVAPEATEESLPAETVEPPEVAAAPIVPPQQAASRIETTPPAVADRAEDFAASDVPTEAAAAETTGATMDELGDLLVAIATQLAPYQPTNTPYPLTYHVQIAPDGTILTAEPISDNAPALDIPADTRVSPPGRPLQLNVVYTGTAQPTVSER